MENIEEFARKQKLHDIKSIAFNSSLEEIVTTMGTILTMYQIDEDEEIVRACKEKLLEGIELLKAKGKDDLVKDFEV